MLGILLPVLFISAHVAAFSPPPSLLRPSASILHPSCPLFSSASLPKVDSVSTILNTDLPPPAVLAAIDSAPTLSASDLASIAGISIPRAAAYLTTLAPLTEASLLVSSEGDLTYSFPANFKSLLSQSSTRAQLDAFGRKVKGPLAYAGKVAFGAVLVASVVAIFATISVVLSSSSDDDDRRRDNRRGGGGMGFGGNFFGPSPFDFFYYRPYYYNRYYVCVCERSERREVRRKDYQEHQGCA